MSQPPANLPAVDAELASLEARRQRLATVDLEALQQVRQRAQDALAYHQAEVAEAEREVAELDRLTGLTARVTGDYLRKVEAAVSEVLRRDKLLKSAQLAAQQAEQAYLQAVADLAQANQLSTDYERLLVRKSVLLYRAGGPPAKQLAALDEALEGVHAQRSELRALFDVAQAAQVAATDLLVAYRGDATPTPGRWVQEGETLKAKTGQLEERLVALRARHQTSRLAARYPLGNWGPLELALASARWVQGLRDELRLLVGRLADHERALEADLARREADRRGFLAGRR